MKNKLALLCFIISFSSLFAQYKYDYNWIFGYNSGFEFEGMEGVILNFNESPLDIRLEETQMNIAKSNACISNEFGELIFYSNGCFVADATHETMENGDWINPGLVHNVQCQYGYTAGTQSCLILPMPEHPNIYYFFHKHLIYIPELKTDSLLYSVVDMTGNGGLGKVTQKNEVAIAENPAAGELTAIKHSNGIDWWIITQKNLINKYNTLLLTPEGFEGPYEQEIGNIPVIGGRGSSQIIFSPDGEKLARFNVVDQLWLFDFDRSTGQLSNFEHYVIDTLPGVTGAAFSSNSRFLYLSVRNHLFQFDMYAPDLLESKVLIDSWDGFGTPLPAAFYKMQLGPDCRIYMNSTNSVSVLHVIHHPNRKGQACEFEQHGIQLPANHFISIPHFPYYRMDTDEPICDSSLMVATPQIIWSAQSLNVFPNPAYDILNVELFEPFRKEGEMILYDGMGKIAVHFELGKGESEFKFSTDGLVSGIYFYRILEDGVLRKTGKVIIQN